MQRAFWPTKNTYFVHKYYIAIYVVYLGTVPIYLHAKTHFRTHWNLTYPLSIQLAICYGCDPCYFLLPLVSCFIIIMVTITVEVRGHCLWNTELGFLQRGTLALQLLTPTIFQPLDLLLENWIGHVTIGLLYDNFVLLTRTYRVCVFCDCFFCLFFVVFFFGGGSGESGGGWLQALQLIIVILLVNPWSLMLVLFSRIIHLNDSWSRRLAKRKTFLILFWFSPLVLSDNVFVSWTD